MKQLTIALMVLLWFSLPARAVVHADGEIGGHEYVEIGGKKWATLNVGATSVADAVPATPQNGIHCYDNCHFDGTYNCFGTYFKWGETRANTTPFDGSHYPTLHKCDKPALCSAHDAATVQWGEGWRMPTTVDYISLYEACGGTGTVTEAIAALTNDNKDTQGIYWCEEGQTVAPEYQVGGMLFVQDATHKVFFPAAGGVQGTELQDAGGYAYYWTASIETDYTDNACGVFFYSGRLNIQFTNGRCNGSVVRAVAD